MLNKINNVFDIKNEEEYLEKYAPPEYKIIRNILGGALLVVCLIFVFMFYNFSQISEKKEGDIYLYNAELNKEKKLDFYYKPSFSEEKMKTHINNTLTDMFSTDFGNVDKRLKTFKKYFSDSAWFQFENFILNDYTKYLKENRLLSSLTIVRDPLLIETGTFYGKRYWSYGVEVFFSYKGSLKNNEIKQVRSKVILTLLEVEPTKNPYGVLINEIYIDRARSQ